MVQNNTRLALVKNRLHRDTMHFFLKPQVPTRIKGKTVPHEDPVLTNFLTPTGRIFAHLDWLEISTIYGKTGQWMHTGFNTGAQWRLLASESGAWALGQVFAGVRSPSNISLDWQAPLPRWVKWADININAPYWHCCNAVKLFAVKAEKKTELRTEK